MEEKRRKEIEEKERNRKGYIERTERRGQGDMDIQ